MFRPLFTWPMLIGWLTLSAQVAAQLADPIPDVPEGNVAVQLRVFASGLPVEQEFITPVFTQRVGPTDLAVVPGSSSLIVTTYGGKAYAMDANGRINDVLFLDLGTPDSPTWNPHFEFGGAHGLTSIAFHPGFADATHPGFGKFYTLEPETSGSGVADFSESIKPGDHHQEVLYEYTLASPADQSCGQQCAESKRELLRVTQPGWHHNLGDLVFDPDGLLFIASGDGSVAATQAPFMSDNSLTLANVFGKVLRIDPLGNNSANGRYGVPSDNPFVDGPGGNVDEIYAYGLRNPYRLEFDRGAVHLYASETGEESIESIEQIVKGGNFGWNTKEGSFLYDKTTRGITEDLDANGNGQGDVAEQQGLIDPLFEYDRGDGRAIVGAVPYEGQLVPGLAGQLVFADFSGKLFYGTIATGEEFRLKLDPAGQAVPFNVHSVNRDVNGELYVLGIVKTGAADFDGVVVKLFASPTRAGDVNGNGELDAQDIDLLSQAVRSASDELFFDLSGDGIVNPDDRAMWVTQLRHSYFGDSNLDGTFDSQDLVDVLAAGQYEDQVPLNSGWASGDWDGDGEFKTQDFLLAMAEGGYETGPRPALSVPEPSSLQLLFVWLSIMLTGLLSRGRRISRGSQVDLSDRCAKN
jgi:hypothetical protein